MDYVSNNFAVVREKYDNHASVILSYDMALAAEKNRGKKGKEKKKHA